MIYCELLNPIYFHTGKLFLEPGIYYVERDHLPDGLARNSTRFWEENDWSVVEKETAFEWGGSPANLREFTMIKLRAKEYHTGINRY